MGSLGRLAALFSLATLVMMMTLIPVIQPVSHASEGALNSASSAPNQYSTATDDGPGTTDPLNGERKIVSQVAFKDTKFGNYYWGAGGSGGLKADYTDTSDPNTRLSIVHLSDNMVLNQAGRGVCQW